MKKISLDVKVNQSFKRRIRQLSGKGNNVDLKKALKRASIIPKKAFQTELRVLRQVSDQSTGATLNSLTNKAQFPSKGNKAYGYAYTGVDMKYEQTTSKKKDFTGAGKVRDHIKKARIAGTSKRKKRTGKVTVRAVKGYQKHVRHSKKSGTKSGHQLSQPGKYWHLINEGFPHRSGKEFPGYKFQQNVASASKAKMLASFKKDVKSFINK